MQLAGAHHRTGAIFGVELGVDVLDVFLDRADADKKLVGDFTVGQPIGDERQHFHFACAERVGKWVIGMFMCQCVRSEKLRP